ncbi:MAG: carbamoyl phosphate synthase large subunit [Bacteroidetes bacterium HGW-Bacteroidetes-11]|nr:MAG: carbamoyl phosphate synthase large subunit [Bacteroidetes bacterium HGW-Bacteroidetes-11]
MKHDIGKVLVLGSGALKIGEAGEFDYSGSQALKALREEGIHTILINPNIATVQTSKGVADTVYFLPVTADFVTKIIEKERPEGILLAFGGQTALNCGVELYRKGILEKYGVKVLGTPVDAIIETEDRQLFSAKLHSISVDTPKSIAVTSVSLARDAAAELGFPIIVRAAFTLGGQGSGFCSNMDELDRLVANAFSYSDQILIEESLKGWKEIEYEVVRDRYDNCITVCNMENFDPLGIHTGESIVVAPSQTLSNAEYHKLRSISIEIVRSVGIVGECNVQFALDPNSEDYRVIEVNARLSRSSALASKATGYPLAHVAAKLALGYGLHELKNNVTRTTSALFEPALDYIVCKIPRWDLNKFSGVAKEIGSSMKSVGEIMSIGRTFEEAIQKGLRMTGLGLHGFVANPQMEFPDLDKSLNEPTDMRIYALAEAFARGYSVERLHELTRIDPWFLEGLNTISKLSEKIKNTPFAQLTPELMREAKQLGFSDFQLARFLLNDEAGTMHERMLKIREWRENHQIKPVVKQIDTLAAEYPAATNYLYLTYNGNVSDISPENDNKSVVVLGSGAYRIGSSVEFDWSGVNALQTIRQMGYRSVMINYNPETVSTDYDMCDRLYFDELSYERVMDILDVEQPLGTILATGGQIANNLAMRLHNSGVHILGTSPVNIDMAEDRHKFSSLLDTLAVDQPRWRELSSIAEIVSFAEIVGYPLLIRPSYVLSGAAMNVVSNPDDLRHFLQVAALVSKEHPVVVSEFIEFAKEIEVDAVADNGEIVVYAISEHVEFAGVHSGDATIVFPAQKLYLETTRRIKRITRQIAMALEITGPFNIQFLAKDNHIKVIECNLRASRSFPFVSKVLKINFIDIATRVMLGQKVEVPHKSMFDIDYLGIKAPQFSFSRLAKADPVLGVDMASTGEVACLGETFHDALLKAMFSVGYKMPERSILLSSGDVRSKVQLLEPVRLLAEKGITIYATRGTAKFLSDNGIDAKVLHWPDENAHPNTLDYIRERKIDLVVNIPKNLTKAELHNDYTIRRSAIDYNIPIITNAQLAAAFLTAGCRISLDELELKSWNEYGGW